MKTYCDSITHSVSRLRSYLQRMRISKCLPPQGNPRTLLSGRTRAYSSSSMPLSAALLFTWHIAGKSRFFYGYNYNCKFSTCQAYFKNFTIYALSSHKKHCLRGRTNTLHNKPEFYYSIGMFLYSIQIFLFYSTLFKDSTISMVFSLKCITPFTTMEKILVRIPLYTKLIGLMLLPNITASTSTVVITYL